MLDIFVSTMGKQHLSYSFSVTISKAVLHKVVNVGFPGGAEVKTLNLRFRGCRWIPVRRVTHALGFGQGEREKKKKINSTIKTPSSIN